MFKVSSTPLESKALSDMLSNSRAGALVTFEGWVRDHNDGSSVTSLEYECYEALAQKEGARVIAEAKEKFDILEAACCHRVGHLPVGEMAVWVGVTSVHRAAAFDACRFIIDEIKLRLPVWKKEHYSNGSSGWVNCSAHEHERHKRHEQKSAASCTEGHSHMHENTKAPEYSSSQFYKRQTAMKEIGMGGQEKLGNSRVLVIGAGGTGCPALQYLVGAGVGQIGICDFDVVDISNLHRQPLYGVQDVGKRKASVAATRLRQANPFVEISEFVEKFASGNAPQIVANYDIVLDCTDNLSAKFCIAEACRTQGKTLLQASVHGFDGQLVMWRPLSEETYEGQCYSCLWPSQEKLQPGGKDCIESCAESGVLGAVPGMLGTMQAMEAIKLIVGLPSSLRENMLLFDLLSGTTSKIKTRKDSNCKACKEGSAAVVEGASAAQTKAGAAKKAGKQDTGEVAAEASAGVADDVAGTTSEDESSDNEFELHWNVLRSRSPRELVYVDIRTAKEREADKETQSRMKSRPLHAWPLEELNIDKLELDRNLTYLFFCQKGKRSGALVRKLRERGHRNVFSLAGGVEGMTVQSGEHARV